MCVCVCVCVCVYMWYVCIYVIPIPSDSYSVPSVSLVSRTVPGTQEELSKPVFLCEYLMGHMWAAASLLRENDKIPKWPLNSYSVSTHHPVISLIVSSFILSGHTDLFACITSSKIALILDLSAAVPSVPSCCSSLSAAVPSTVSMVLALSPPSLGSHHCLSLNPFLVPQPPPLSLSLCFISFLSFFLFFFLKGPHRGIWMFPG